MVSRDYGYQNSTKAIETGHYREINAVGGSSIAAVINATKPRRIPYGFGGDGASFCIPPELLELAMDSAQPALRARIISCLTAETGIDHIHFVDSANGGYVVAAKQLKQQISMEKQTTSTP